MHRVAPPLLALLLTPAWCLGQASGNVGYGQAGGKAAAEQAERAKRTVAKDDQPPSATSTFLEANVLLNVKADEFVAVFGIAHEAETVAECNRKVDATVKEFTDAVQPLGLGAAALFVDFAAQNKIYGFEIMGDVAREKLVGFELKKTIAVHYKDKALLDQLTVAAAKVGVFDLIKVDYVVKDLKAVQDKLLEEAGRVLKAKLGRYEKLLGIKLQPPAQVYAERARTYYPTRMYDSYTAHEAEAIGNVPNRQKYTVQGARKSRTFFYNALDGDGFDAVLNPVVTEPVVQFTLYLKVKYEVEQLKAR